MSSHSKKLRDLLDRFDNNKIHETQMVIELYDISDDWNNKLSFEPKIKKLIRNHDNYFDLLYGEFKHTLIEFFNDYAFFHTEEYPLKVSFRKEDIYIDEERLEQFLYKVGLNVDEKIETDEEIFYISRL